MSIDLAFCFSESVRGVCCEVMCVCDDDDDDDE